MFGNSIVASDYEDQTVEELRDQVQKEISQLVQY